LIERPLRVLELYPKTDYFTGAAIQLRELARGLVARGHQVTVATPPGPHGARLADDGVEHVTLPLRRAWDPRAAWRLRRLLRARDFDVVHAHKGRARTLAILAGLVGPRPPLVLNRGVSFVPGRLNRLGYTTRRVDAIVAVCRSIKADLVGLASRPTRSRSSTPAPTSTASIPASTAPRSGVRSPSRPSTS